MINLYT